MCSKSQVPPMRNPILLRTATDVSEEIRQGKLKSVDVLNAYFERIEEVNPLIHAVTDRDKENAFQQANYIDNLVEEGSALTLNMPLLGVPISVKDTIDVKGMRATRGLVSRRNVFATQDSKVVENIRKSGGIPIVATNIPELLSWFDSSNKAFGKTKNPYNFSRVPGGSSGGEGALIAAGGSLIGLGTDVGGSLRIPASFCGIFSHKISPGLTPLAGVYPEIKSDFNFLLTVGPMCRYADDLIPTIKALTETKAGMLSDLNQPIDLKALKYHYLLDVPAPQKTKLAKDVKMKFMETVRILEESLDIKFTEVNPKTFSESHELWVKIYVRSTVIAFRDALSDGKDHLNLCLEMFKSIGGCSKHTFKSLLVAALVDAELKKDIPTSTLIEERNKLLAAFENLIGPNDILLCPTHPEVAPKHWSTVFKSTDIANATLFNILGVPVTNCPIGFNNKGLPIGVQIASRQYNDRLTIALAKKLDEILGGWKASWVSV